MSNDVRIPLREYLDEKFQAAEKQAASHAGAAIAAASAAHTAAIAANTAASAAADAVVKVDNRLARVETRLEAIEKKGPTAASWGAAGTFLGGVIVAIASFLGIKPNQ